MSALKNRKPAATSGTATEDVIAKQRERLDLYISGHRTAGTDLRGLKTQVEDLKDTVTAAECDDKVKDNIKLVFAKRRLAGIDTAALEAILTAVKTAIDDAETAVNDSSAEAERKVTAAYRQLADLQAALTEGKSLATQAEDLLIALTPESPATSGTSDPADTPDAATVAAAKAQADRFMPSWRRAGYPALKDYDSKPFTLCEPRPRNDGIRYTPLNLDIADAELKDAAIMCVKRKGKFVPSDDDMALTYKWMVIRKHEEEHLPWSTTP